MKTIFATTAAALVLSVTASFALTTVDVTNQLQTQGYTQISVKKGIVKATITASGPNGTRTIVVNQKTGQIVSDSGASTATGTGNGMTGTNRGGDHDGDHDGREGHNERDGDRDGNERGEHDGGGRDND